MRQRGSRLVLGMAALAIACGEDRAGADGGGSSSAGSAGSAGIGASGGEAAGGSAGSAGFAGAGGVGGAPEYPLRLSETGLYRDVSRGTLAEGVREYTPRFVLWSDGADKRRFVWLPPGTQIDSSDPDYWRYPIGTRAWKEFTRGDIRVETRLLEKRGEGDWLMLSYVWDAAQLDALATPEGQPDALDTEHDVPSSAECAQCHKHLPDQLLGFSGLQLAHDASPLRLADLTAEGLLGNPSPDYALPGDATAQAALGYLHANCGNCHNPESATFFRVDIDLWLRAGRLSSVAETPTYETSVGVPPFATSTPEITARIEPGRPEASLVHARMADRGDPAVTMPPVGSELVHPDGLSTVDAWILALKP